MVKTAFTLLFILLATQTQAQYSLHIIVTVPPGTTAVYLMGSLNNWDPGDNNYRLTPLDQRHMEIKLKNIKPGEEQFKFTRGTGATMECTNVGLTSPDHIIRLQTDTTIRVVVEAWSDGYFDLSSLSDSLLYEAMMNRAGYYVEINLDSSNKYAARLYQLAQNLSLMKRARALDLQAVIYSKQGNGDKALGLLYKSLELKRSLRDSSTISFVYYSIGNIYEGLTDYDKAKENYWQAYDWALGYTGPYMGILFTKIASLFSRAGKLDSASYYAAKAILYDKYCVGALLLMGDILHEKGQSKMALDYLEEALIANKHSTPGNPFFTNSAETYKKMAEVYYTMRERDSALYYGRKAFAMAAIVRNPYTMMSTADGLADIFGKEKNFDSAYYYQRIVLQKKDSLFAGDKERQIHTIYNNEKLRQQELVAQQEKYDSRLKLYSLLGLLILLVLGGLAYRVRLRSKFTRQIAEIEMRALRAQMNPHFIFNCLTSINRYIVMSDAKTASAYLTKFAKLIRLILDNSASEFIPWEAEIQTLQLYLDMELLRFDHSFTYNIDYEKVSMGDSKLIPTMIIQPYVENAIWHGLLHKETKGKLWIRFGLLKNDIVQVEIEDNGIGRKEAALLKSKVALKTKSFGMQISGDRIRIMNRQRDILSSVVIEDLLNPDGSAAGTKIILQLPLLKIIV